MYIIKEELAGTKYNVAKTKTLIFPHKMLDECMNYLETTLIHTCSEYKKNLRISITYMDNDVREKTND